MGNRAVIAMSTKPFNEYGPLGSDRLIKDALPAIYLHWHGDKPHVDAFLKAAKQLGVREDDAIYGMGRLTQIIGNYIGGALSLGVGTVGTLDIDNNDNGLFWIDPNFNIAGREHNNRPDLQLSDEKQLELLHKVIEANPQFFTV